MVKIYFYDNLEGDQRLPHEGPPATAADLQDLGVYAANITEQSEVDRIAKERGYKNRDEVAVSEEKLGEKYPAMIKNFYEEHLHIDEEIRWILDGEGFFDVRNKNEQWIRCALHKGDFLILPAGIYHRFTPAKSDFVHAMRLFKDEPKWTAYPRKDGSDFPERAEYLQQIGLAH